MNAYRKKAPLLAFRPPVILLLSTLLYFYPALSGGVLLYSISRNGYYQIFARDTYFVVIFIISLLLVISVVFRNKPVMLTKSKLPLGSAAAFAFLWFPLLIYVFATSALFSPDKHEVLAATNRFHLIFIYTSVIGVIAGVSTFGKSSRFVMSLGVIGVFLFVYIGHRAYLAFAILGVVYYYFRNKSLARIRIKYLFAIFISYFFMVFYKNIYVAIKYGDFQRVVDILSRRETADLITTGSEQFTIFSQLDMVIRHNYSLECSNFFITPFTIIPFTNEFFDITECSFNAQVQPTFYAEYAGGVAANIWAEFYANFGIFGFLIFIACSLGLTKVFEYVLSKSHEPFLNASIIVAIIQMLFYTQRNEFLTSFTLAKRSIIIGVILMVISALFRLLLRGVSGVSSRSGGIGSG